MILEPILNGQWQAAEKLKTRSSYASIAALIECYRSSAEERRTTVRNNIAALRMIVRSVYGGDPDQQSVSVLTGELVREFQRLRVEVATSDMQRRRAKAGIRSYVAQARSVVATKKMRHFEGLNLPDLSSFRQEKVDSPKRAKPRPLNTGVIEAINAAAPDLIVTDPAVYVAFLMFSRLGMRNIESATRDGVGLRTAK